MHDLIDLLESAVRPSRELDAMIGAACKIVDARLFTSSIEAALTLVPEHHSYELTQSAAEPPAMARARLWDWRRGPLMSDPNNEWKSEGNRPLEINICIAALKARRK